MNKSEAYLGDGLYVSDDGFQFRLRAPRLDGDHEVYLDPEVMRNFMNFVEKSRGLKIEVTKCSQ